MNELSSSSRDLTKITDLNFQMSEFSVMMLYELFVLYKKHPRMQDLPYVIMESSATHFESESIISQLMSEGKLGIAFLKRLVFTGNDLADITLTYD